MANTQTHGYKQTDIQTHRQTNRQTYRHTYGQTVGGWWWCVVCVIRKVGVG